LLGFLTEGINLTQLLPEQLTKAEKLAREWKPK